MCFLEDTSVNRCLVFRQNFVALRLEILAKEQKKKQHYRYSQSRWNTYIVVSSISKIKLKAEKVKLVKADL